MSNKPEKLPSYPCATELGLEKEFGESGHFSLDRVVGWRAVYEDWRVYDSIHNDAKDLPERDCQLVQIFYLRHDGKRNADGTKMLFALNLTGRDDYPIPGTGRIVHGDWTSSENHRKIVDLHSKIGWVFDAD